MLWCGSAWRLIWLSKNKIEVGDVQAFFQYIRNFTQPIQQVAQVTNMLQSSAAASERVFEFLDVEEEEAQMVEGSGVCRIR